MSDANAVQTNRVQYTDINTDFGYDALGGVGHLGSHSVEALQPGTRQTNRIAGPRNTIGRWFARLFDRMTPSSWRAQGKFKRGLEDFSAGMGRLLGHLHNAAGQSELPEDERRAEQAKALKELSGLRHLAEPMTSRNTDYKELVEARVRRNLTILKEESPHLWQQVLQLGRINQSDNSNPLSNIIANLDPDTQNDMIEDLRLIHSVIQEAFNAQLRTDTGEPVNAGGLAESQAAPSVQEQQTSEESTYQSRFNDTDLRGLFWSNSAARARAQNALSERMAALTNFTGEARSLLESTLEEVGEILRGDGSVDPDRLALARRNVEQRMGRAIRCASDDVCTLALRYLNRQASAGVDGQDYFRGNTDNVMRELNEIERAVSSGDSVHYEIFMPHQDAQVPEDPFQRGIQQARQQIQEITLIYGELSDGLNELETRNRRIDNCSVLVEFARTNPASSNISWQRLSQTCDDIIAALQDPAQANRENVSYLLNDVQRWAQADYVPASLRERLMAALPSIAREFEPTQRPNILPPDSATAQQTLVRVEHARAAHHAVGDAGALLQRTRLPQADSLIAWGLEISRQVVQMRTTDWSRYSPVVRQNANKDIRAAVSRFMSHLALAQMQTEHPTIFERAWKQTKHPNEKDLPKANKTDAQVALDMLQRSVEILVNSLNDDEGGAMIRTAFNDGRHLVNSAKAAAEACNHLLENRYHKETNVAEQLAVCVESGLENTEAALIKMMDASRWNKGKHLEAKNAIAAFLACLEPVRESRDQSDLLRQLNESMRLYNIVAYDVYRGFDGKFHMLINTDRIMASSQGARWVTLPDPDDFIDELTKKPNTKEPNTGVTRLDDLLSTHNQHNRTVWYPNFYDVLTTHLGSATEFMRPRH